MLRKPTRGQCAVLSLLWKREPSPPATHTVLSVPKLLLILKTEKLVSRLAPSECAHASLFQCCPPARAASVGRRKKGLLLGWAPSLLLLGLHVREQAGSQPHRSPQAEGAPSAD